MTDEINLFAGLKDSTSFPWRWGSSTRVRQRYGIVRFVWNSWRTRLEVESVSKEWGSLHVRRAAWADGNAFLTQQRGGDEWSGPGRCSALCMFHSHSAHAGCWAQHVTPVFEATRMRKESTVPSSSTIIETNRLSADFWHLGRYDPRWPPLSVREAKQAIILPPWKACMREVGNEQWASQAAISSTKVRKWETVRTCSHTMATKKGRYCLCRKLQRFWSVLLGVGSWVIHLWGSSAKG